jgi:hypothetical protein
VKEERKLFRVTVLFRPVYQNEHHKLHRASIQLSCDNQLSTEVLHPPVLRSVSSSAN